MVRKRASGSTALAATAITIGAAAFTGIAALGMLSVYVARRVIIPSKTRVEDLRILGSTETTVLLSKTLDTLAPGQYSLWFSEGTGHAKVGAILDVGPNWVSRELLGVDHGDLVSATRGSIAGWFYLDPEQLGSKHRDVVIETPVGPAPAWLIPAEKKTGRWLIGVHGRGVRRQECLRAVEVARRCGYTSLLVSYRNDGDAPRSPDGRYGLGDTEWPDVNAALEYAIENGATEVVLMGWSMGGAISLQVATRSPHAGIIKGIILESPVVNWVDTINYQTDAQHAPRIVSAAARSLISSAWARRLTGQGEPIDLDRLDFVARADELAIPILLMHSADDGFVPPYASRALALARPDIVTFDEFTVARHAKLWNYDAERFNEDIGSWLNRLP
jgi:alpha-beta hydrolase superfamily lysophospholipase